MYIIKYFINKKLSKYLSTSTYYYISQYYIYFTKNLKLSATQVLNLISSVTLTKNLSRIMYNRIYIKFRNEWQVRIFKQEIYK